LPTIRINTVLANSDIKSMTGPSKNKLKKFTCRLALLVVCGSLSMPALAKEWHLLSTTELPPTHKLWKKYEVKIDIDSIKRNGDIVEFFYTIEFYGHIPKHTYSIGKTKLNTYDCMLGKSKHPDTGQWTTPVKGFIGAIAQKFACNW
jgi:hypothetical protein